MDEIILTENLEMFALLEDFDRPCMTQFGQTQLGAAY